MNAIVEIINAAGQRFVASALPMLIQSGVLILILLAVNLVLRRKVRAIFRYWIWMLVLVKLVLPPSLGSPVSIGTWFGDKLEVSTTNLFEPEEPLTTQAPVIADRIVSRPVPTFVAPPAPATETPTRQPTSPTDRTAVEASPPASQIKAAAPTQPPATALTWQGLVLLFWSAAVMALLLLLLQRAFFVQGLVAQAEEPNQALLNALAECRGRLALRGPIALKISPNASSPAVCGLVHPVVLIPHNLAPKLHGRDVQGVLLHELAHVKRGDLWVNLAQTLLQIVYFYNPLLWVANTAIRRAREQAVDETVLVAMGETARHYPETLLHVAKLAFRRRPVLSLRLIGVVESKSALAGRIKHILNRPIPKTARLGLLGLLVVVLVAAVMLPMAKARPMTDRTRDVLALAEDEARSFNHGYVGTEHILVALSRRSDAVSAKVLENLGVDTDALRAQMRTLFKPGSEPSGAGKLPQTPRAKQALKRAVDEARSLGHDYIGTEHLLLALAKDRESVATQMLHGLGLTTPQIRAEILKLVRPGRADASRADEPTTGPTVSIPSADTDGDGLSDFQEVHKYLTDPAQQDSDGDGTPDGDWDERREYAYSIRTVLRYLPPFNDGGLNDDFQDARLLKQTDDYVEIEVVHYPLATSQESIPENANWRQDYAHMSEHLAPGVTTNWDEPMKRDLLAALKADGIDVETLTDKQVVEQVSRWLMKRSRSLDNVFTTFYVYCANGRPQVYPGLEEAFQNEFNRDSSNYDWPIEQHFDHELLGKGMFYNKTHGSCTSVAVYLTTVLRALGIPTRMVLVTPAVDASDREQILMVKNALTHNRVRETILTGLRRSSRGFTNHTFNEVYVGNRWCRLDYTQLGCGILGLHRFGLQTHVYTFNDLSDINLAATWGVRYARGERNDTFKHSNPYTAVEISERFGSHGNIANPPFATQELSSSRLPNIFILYPSGISVWDELMETVKDRTWDKTGRPHAPEYYENLFEGVWFKKPGDILVLLFSLDTPERVPPGYEDLLPKSWTEIESQLKQGRTVELSGKARDMNVILLAAPTKDELAPLVRNSKLLRAPGTPTEEQDNRPSEPVSPPSAPFAVRVNENVEIELLGICDHPSEGGLWWRPDGSPMETAPYRTTGSRLDREEGYEDYEFALRVSGPSDTAIAWIVPGGNRGSYTGRARDADGQALDDIYAYTSNQSADAERANVFIGVASGAWETRAVHKTLSREGSYTLEDNKAIAFGIAYMKGSETLVPVTTSLKSKEANRRLIAVDVNGDQHVAGGTGYGGNVLHSGTSRFDVPLDQIRELRFEMRPYTWVAYRDVSLDPGRETDVTIELMDTETMMLSSRRAPGQEKICGIGPAWEALKDRAGKRYSGTIGGFSTNEKRCREYFAQVLSWTAPSDTLALMLAFDQSVAIPPQYADLLPLPWPEIEGRIKKGELVEAQGSARNLNVLLLAAPTLEQLDALVRQTPLLNTFQAATIPLQVDYAEPGPTPVR